MPITAFPSTHWSLLLDTHDPTDVDRSRKALETLLLQYEKPLLKYLTSKCQHCEHDAKDLLQGFIADQILAKTLIHRADRTRGRFRNLLLQSLENYRIDQWRKQQRQPTLESLASKSVHPDSLHADPSSRVHADVFYIEWAREVLREALLKSQKHFVASGRSCHWRLFEIKFLEPILDHTQPASYQEIAEQLGFQSPSAVSTALVTTKRHLVRQLHETIRNYVADDDQIEEEIADLWKILSMSRA